jgi:kynureninase
MDPEARGAQLSILLKPGLLPAVFAKLQEEGIVFDQRKPDVIRIAPVPLYNSFEDVRFFVDRFKAVLMEAAK